MTGVRHIYGETYLLLMYKDQLQPLSLNLIKLLLFFFLLWPWHTTQSCEFAKEDFPSFLSRLLTTKTSLNQDIKMYLSYHTSICTAVDGRCRISQAILYLPILPLIRPHLPLLPRSIREFMVHCLQIPPFIITSFCFSGLCSVMITDLVCPFVNVQLNSITMM